MVYNCRQNFTLKVLAHGPNKHQHLASEPLVVVCCCRMFFIGLSNLRSPTIIPQLLGIGVAGPAVYKHLTVNSCNVKFKDKT